MISTRSLSEFEYSVCSTYENLPLLYYDKQPFAGSTLIGYRLETGTAAELRLALTITLSLTDTGFAVLTLLLGYTRRSPDPNARTQEALS